MAAASTGWNLLTDQQLSNWNAAGMAHPRVDALGQKIKLTGQMLFVSVNASLLNIGLPMVTDPPADWTLPALTNNVVVAQDDAYLVLFPDGLPGTTTVSVASSQPVSGGTSYMKNVTQLGYVPPGFGGIDLTVLQQAQFGDTVVGQKVFYRLTPTNGSGVSGAPIFLSDRTQPFNPLPTPTLYALGSGQYLVTWPDANAYDVYLFDIDTLPPFPLNNDIEPGQYSGFIATVGSINLTCYVKMTDGLNWSPASNTQFIN